MSVLVKPWDAIQGHYASVALRVPSARHMEQLVVAIRGSRYVEGLFAWTSMFDLCIVQTPATYPYQGPLLRVSPNEDGELLFRYEDTPDKSKQWQRSVPGDAGFAMLEHFFTQLGWFPDSLRA